MFLAGRIIVKRARRFIDMCEGVLEVERDEHRQQYMIGHAIKVRR